MSTTDARWQRVNELFHAVLARSAGERDRFLSAECGTDAALRLEVQSLIDAHRTGTAMGSPTSLSPGRRLGDYEVVSFLAAGGMGEVYRARDTKLRRDAALKILPAGFIADPDRRARFDREARLLASLNHPNIAMIYGFVERDGVSALALEFVEGETLAERIARGKLPIDDALRIAKQIAEALEAAHEQGIVHRDLKPANIKLTRDNQVKVLDFGLATTSGLAGAVGESAWVTSEPTAAGIILGTAPYMSPEQARGQPIDKRTDIWAFGCVLYEMLTGTRAFPGETTTDALASILQREVDFSRLPEALPARVHVVLARALVKDPKHRLRDIGDAWLELQGEGARPTPPLPIAGSSSRGRGVWFAAATLAIAVSGAAIGWWLRSGAESRPDSPVRADVVPPAGTELEVGFGFGALSPDGKLVVLVARTSAGEKLFVRTVSTGAVRELPGTDGAQLPFWSPDSASVAFFSGGKLQRIDLAAGSPIVIANAPTGGRGGSWNRDGVIIYNAVNDGPILRVEATGGAATPLTRVETSQTENSHRYPVFLPDGRHFVFFVRADDRTRQGIYLSSLDEPTRKIQLVRASFGGTFVSLRDGRGYLIWLRDSAIVAQQLDVGQQRLLGEPHAIVDGIEGTANTPSPVSASPDGTMLYGSRPVPLYQVTVYSREGRPLDTIGTAERYTMLALSPDGRRLALSRDAPDGSDAWVLELSREIPTRVTSNHRVTQVSTWSPDGRRFVYNAGAPPNLFVTDAAGVGVEQRLSASSGSQAFASWSPDGRHIMFAATANDPASSTRTDLQVFDVDQQRVAPYLVTPSAETNGRFSPDGEWIAYISDESGRDELYIQSFPAGRGKWRLSMNGAASPRWRRDGQELFFVAPDQSVMAVSVHLSGQAPQFGVPHPLFRLADSALSVFTAGTLMSRSNVAFDVFPDGNRFIALATASGQDKTAMSLIVNWPAALR